jgi:hypothetical protein
MDHKGLAHPAPEHPDRAKGVGVSFGGIGVSFGGIGVSFGGIRVSFGPAAVSRPSTGLA